MGCITDGLFLFWSLYVVIRCFIDSSMSKDVYFPGIKALISISVTIIIRLIKQIRVLRSEICIEKARDLGVYRF